MTARGKEAGGSTLRGMGYVLTVYHPYGFEEREVVQTPWGEEVMVCEWALKGAKARSTSRI